MHRSLILFLSMLVTVAMISGCAGTNWNRADTGTVVGGVVGGAVGSQIGSGTGSTIATVIGTLGGAVLGRKLGQNMMQDDRQQFGSALETNSTGNTSSWVNPDTDSRYAVTPTNTYTANGSPCREFRMQANVDGTADTVTGTACRQPNGTWRVQ